MDGFRVMPMEQAAPVGDFFVTVTGNLKVIRGEHFAAMKEGAIVCNSRPLQRRARYSGSGKTEPARSRVVRPGVEEFTLKNGAGSVLLGEGRLVNLATAEGHPSSVMDMSFANQALGAEYIVKNHKKLEKKVYPVPPVIDKEIARLKLAGMGVTIDTLTKEQNKYLRRGKWGHSGRLDCRYRFVACSPSCCSSRVKDSGSPHPPHQNAWAFRSILA